MNYRPKNQALNLEKEIKIGESKSEAAQDRRVCMRAIYKNKCGFKINFLNFHSEQKKERSCMFSYVLTDIIIGFTKTFIKSFELYLKRSYRAGVKIPFKAWT